MKRVQFSLKGGLTEADLQQIHEQVLKVLEHIGLEDEHDESRLAAARHPGVREDGSRLYFAPELVDEFVERSRQEHSAEPAPDEITMEGPWNCLSIEDLETGEVRASTLEDARQMFKLLHAAGAGHICPVYPHDVPPHLQVLAVDKAGLELTQGDGSLLEYSDHEMLDFAIAMYAAAGRKYHMSMQFPISPLKADRTALETVWHFMGRDDLRITASASPIPQAGATAPLFIPGALVQAAAEALGTYMLIRLTAGDRVACAPGYRIDLFDLKTTVLACGSPMYILYQLCLKDLWQFYYGTPMRSHFLLSNAKTCDAQAVMERTAFVLTMALAGFRRFWLGAGQLSLDEVFSPVLFIVDQEMARYVTHIIQGIDYDEGVDASYEAIVQGVAEGNYFMHDSTLANMRKDFDSDIFPRLRLESWRAAGCPSWRDKAQEKVKELIESHDFALPDDVQAEVDRIYQQAVEVVHSRR